MSSGNKYISSLSDLRYIYIDLRSSDEFLRSHIPGSISVPLISNVSSKKSRSRNKLIRERTALAYTSSEWADRITQNVSNDLPYILICNDGGIRSEFARDALIPVNETYILKGGYRQYRRLVGQTFCEKYKFIVLAGKTGTGKTELLQKLKLEGFQTLDLESIADSSGSVFGRIGKTKSQPSQEQFENNISEALRQLKISESIFVEQEHLYLGHNWIPYDLRLQFQNAPKIILRLPFKERIRLLVEKYSKFEHTALKSAIMQLAPRIGQDDSDLLVNLVDEAEYSKVAERLLSYYDGSEGYTEIISGNDIILEEESIGAFLSMIKKIKKETPPV